MNDKKKNNDNIPVINNTIDLPEPSMKLYLTSSDSIEKTGLSARSHNALRRAGVHTIDEMLALDNEQMRKIKNLGAISIDEIEQMQKRINAGGCFGFIDKDSVDTIGEEHDEEPAIFIDSSGMQFYDIPLKDLQLSYRANRILTEAGYDYASKLLDVTAEQLLMLPNMGKESVYETLSKIADLKFVEATDSDEHYILAEKNCAEFISSFISHIPAYAGELYGVLLPAFRVALENNTSVDFEALYKTPILRKLVTNKIIATIKDCFFGVRAEDIFSLLPDTLISANSMNAILQELSADGIICIDQMINLRRPSLWEYVDSIPDERQRETLKLRLQGHTLEEIGIAQLGVTRERVRQIIQKCLRNKHVTIEEDKYLSLVEKYAFSKEDFLVSFDAAESVYIYLMLVIDKVGELSLEQLLEDTEYPVELRKGVKRAVYRNYFTIGGARVLKRRTELADYVVHTYFHDEAPFDVFLERYNAVLLNLDLAEDSQFTINRASYQNRLADADNVLWKYPSRFRFYDMIGRDFTALLNGLDLSQYVDVELSSLKIFRSHPELMEEYDIRDEYELHNLLKKLHNKNNLGDIAFPRMPTIRFGKVDRDNQVLELLLHLAPVDVSDFCAAYEEEYGVLARTVAGSHISCIDEYRDSNNIFDISSEPLPAEQMKRMQKIAPDDYYNISTITHLYLNEFPDASPDMINSYTLKSLGFKVYSSYVIRDSYASAMKYFRHILTADDIIDAREFPSTLTLQKSYASELCGLKSRYEIIEFEPQQYINRRRLEGMGISALDIEDYCDKVSQFVQPYDYFTIHSLRRQGFTHSMDALDFGDWFFASLLTEDRERYHYQRMGGTKVFCQSSDQFIMEDFFEFIVEKYGNLDIGEFVQILKNEFDVSVDKHKIVEVISNSPMYYDRVMGRIHKCNDAYDELNNYDDKKKAVGIIATKFKNGFRMSSNIDFERFMDYYSLEYGEHFTYTSDNLYALLINDAVIFDDRAYVYSDEIAYSVREFLKKMEFPCISTSTFFENYSAELYTYNIFSIDMLELFIERYFRDIYCKRDYIYLNADTTPTDLVRNAFKEQEVWSLSELHGRIPYLKTDTIRQILNRSEYLRIDTGVFMHMDSMKLPENEGEKVAGFISDRLKSEDYIIVKQLDLSSFELLNPHCSLSIITNAVFDQFLSDQYKLNGQLITRKGTRLSVLEILEHYCRESDTVSFEELKDFEATFDPDGRTHSACITAGHNTMVRVSAALFVADSRINFDVDGIDNAISLYCSDNFLPLQSVIDFSLFPYTGYPWNHFLLESYVRRFSHVFKYDVRADNSANIGVIVRKSFAYSGYDDVLALALAKSTITLNDKKAVGDYLFDNGYIGWRNLGKAETKIVQNARTLRERGAI